jgi:hypothetical protein
VATRVFVDNDAARADELGELNASSLLPPGYGALRPRWEAFRRTEGYSYYAKIAARLGASYSGVPLEESMCNAALYSEQILPVVSSWT